MKRNQVWLNERQKETFIDVSVFLLKSALIGIAFAIAMSSPYFLNNILKAYLKAKKQQVSEKDLEKVIEKIHRDKLVKVVEKNGKQYLKTTEKGKRQLVQYSIDTIKIQDQKWDGDFRLVMFDIPEELRLARRVLRDKIREIGFIKIQKSVWASPYECKNEIDFIASVYGVERYINYAIVKEIDNKTYLKKRFGLKSTKDCTV